MSSVRPVNPGSSALKLILDHSLSLVGVYRLLTDPPLRKAVWDKLKHATARGLLISTAYVAVTYKTQRWFVSTFLMGGFGLFGKTKPPPELVESSLGWLRDADIVDCKLEAFPSHTPHLVLNSRFGRHNNPLHPPPNHLPPPLLPQTQPPPSQIPRLGPDRQVP